MDAQAVAKLEPFVLVAKGSRGAATANAIEQATSAPGVFVFAELLQLSSVQELQSHETHAPWFALLQLFAYGTYSTYRAAPERYPVLNEQQIVKLKQLSVVTMGSLSRTLPYETLLTTLELANVRALEDLLIDAVFLQAIRGKMDQRRACFVVDEVVGRDLDGGMLGEVALQLENWAATQQRLVNDLSATITLAQASSGRHQSQLLAYQMQRDQALVDAAKVPPPPATMGGGPSGLGDQVELTATTTTTTGMGKGKKPPARESPSQSHQRKRNRN